MSEPNTIKINEIEYVRKDSLSQPVKKLNGLKYCIIRTYSAGVFAGYLASHKDKEVILKDARRIWYWEGAASLSQLAMEGTSKPNNCKFPCPVDSIILTEAIEIIDCAEKARISIMETPIWKK